MRVLVDTSVWSQALRRGDTPGSYEAEELRHLIDAHLVDIIGPVRQELLSGVREQSQFERLEAGLAAFPDLPLLTEDYVTAANYFDLCCSRGIQGSNTDFLICAVAVRQDLAIFTTDGDFRQFSKCLPVVLYATAPDSASSPVHHNRCSPGSKA